MRYKVLDHELFKGDMGDVLIEWAKWFSDNQPFPSDSSLDLRLKAQHSGEVEIEVKIVIPRESAKWWVRKD